MGFNKCILPSIIIMEAEIKSIGLKKFIEQMKKYDSIMGESDRMNFLDEKYKEYQKIFMEDEDHH